ncbi:MAG: preprotein translocase subunit SecE [Deltaproteobacteria bacterium]|nr:MAG: preprotein translocase subunit SecE [Deltaproteobacteria bacterium]
MKKSKKKKKKKSVVASKGSTDKPKAVAVAESRPVKSRKPVAKASVKDRTVGVVNTVNQFLREVRAELSKVTWPTRKDTIASTSVVLVIVIIIAAFLGLVDLGLSKLMRLVLS